MKIFNIQHEPGYILYRNKHDLHQCQGIYIVYKCDYNTQNDSVDIKDILYIGQTDNIFERHNNPQKPHEHNDDFVREAGGKEHICFGEILLPDIREDDLETIEAALIHIQKPPVNTDNKSHYTKSASDITMTGGPDCWNTKRFIHPFNNGDEIANYSLLESLKDYKQNK